MSDNPFQSPMSQPEAPPPQAEGVVSGQWKDLKSVAVYQKGIMFGILFNLLSYGAAMSMGGSELAEAAPMLILVLACVALLGALVSLIFTVLLSMKVYNVAVGILLGLFAIVPCIGLIILFVVNSKATQTLQANGIKIGLMGARLSDVDQAIASMRG